MPRRFFGRFLPSPESIGRNRQLRLFGDALHHPGLWHLNRRSVAGGVSVGLFAGLIPGPFQMLGAALLAVLLRVNLPLAVFVTLYTNPLTIVPLYVLAFKLGSLVTGWGGAGAPPPPPDLFELPLNDWIPALGSWVGAMGKPLFIGLLLLALTLAAAGYLAADGAWRLHVRWSWRKRRLARSDPPRR